MSTVSVFNTTRFTALAAGDVLAAVDISDLTQSAHGSLDSITVTNFFASIPVPVNVTSASATALAVGLNGATNPAFAVDASTALQVAGLKVKGAVAGGTVAIVTTDSGAANNLTINALGTGTIGIGSVSTGRVTITPVTTITGSLTLSAALVYGGVTLSNAVTGTGNMVLSASPTFTGTITAAAANLSGALTALTFGGVTMSAGAVSGVTTLAGSGAVSGFTTAVFSSTMTVGSLLGPSGADLDINSVSGAANAVRINRSGGTGGFIVFAGNTTTSNMTITDAGVVTFRAGVSGITTLAGSGAVSGFTSATLSSFVQAASARTGTGTQNCVTATPTTLFATTGAGVYLVIGYNTAAGIGDMTIISYDGVNVPGANEIWDSGGGGGSTIDFNGGNIRYTQNSGSDKVITWSYVRIA